MEESRMEAHEGHRLDLPEMQRRCLVSAAHTPTLLSIAPRDTDRKIVDSAGKSIAVATRRPDGDGIANANRIVACWNALSGLNPEAVKDVAAMLEACRRFMEENPGSFGETHALLTGARAALAKLKQ
jgi:hypothetical protein